MEKLHKQVLHTEVRVRTQKAGGSGTVVASVPDGKFYNVYIATCHHVVDDAITVEAKWDSVLKKERKQESINPVIVEFFNWDGVPHGVSPLTSGTSAEIAAYNQKHDIAIIKLRIREKPATASLLHPDLVEEVKIGSPVVIVGCALGHDPILTQGIITHQGDIIDGYDYMMSSAQIIFGNSGGGVFIDVNDKYHFIGIPSRVDVTGWGTAVTHLGYFSPITRFYKFCEEQKFDFLIPGSKKTEADSIRERKELLDREERKMYE